MDDKEKFLFEFKWNAKIYKSIPVVEEDKKTFVKLQSVLSGRVLDPETQKKVGQVYGTDDTKKLFNIIELNFGLDKNFYLRRFPDGNIQELTTSQFVKEIQNLNQFQNSSRDLKKIEEPKKETPKEVSETKTKSKGQENNFEFYLERSRRIKGHLAPSKRKTFSDYFTEMKNLPLKRGKR
jgi:hypothetical protein